MLIRLVVEQTLGQATASGDGNRRQLDRTGVITNRINSWNTGVLELIDNDVAFVVGFHAGHGQVEIVIRRFTANRPDQAVDGLAAAIFQRQRQAAVGVFHHRFWHGVDVQFWPFGVHHFNQRFYDQRIKAAQRRVFTHEQVRFGAQAVNHACQFNGDVTCTHYCYAFWQRRQFEETVGVDTVFHARNVRVARTTAGGNQDMIGSDRLAVHFDRFRINETRKATDHIDIVFAQHVVIRSMDAVNVSGTAGNQLVPVEVINGGVETVIRAVHMDGLADLRGVPHHFFRYTTDVHAGAAQLFGFNQRTFLAVHGCTVNRGDTAAAAANGDVVIMLAHGSYP
ncbi:hypothetical protein D3C72_852990 [compost metagenome]